VPTRGASATQSLEQSADFGHLEGVLTRRSDHLAAPCHTLTRFVGKAAKRKDWTGACSPSRFP